MSDTTSNNNCNCDDIVYQILNIVESTNVVTVDELKHILRDKLNTSLTDTDE